MTDTSNTRKLRHRKKEKVKSDGRTLAERIVSQRETAAKEAQFFPTTTRADKEDDSMDPCNNPPQTSDRAENTFEFWDDSDSSESVDITHLTKETTDARRTPTPEPTHCDSNSSFITEMDFLHQSNELITNTFASNDFPSSYNKPLQPVYSTYLAGHPFQLNMNVGPVVPRFETNDLNMAGTSLERGNRFEGVRQGWANTSNESSTDIVVEKPRLRTRSKRTRSGSFVNNNQDYNIPLAQKVLLQRRILAVHENIE
ncbi:Hypothetical predicted protein [Octopus vulgaris]|uniref:Uncharacterized protein n=1 Tax=Octopus vulgaris TaxID=6645 RepID=A0AA36FHW8_OCTVU|nr:Hypothetical predicted protein [Octopus vulgaris]